jgi:hypothetical protein
MPTLAREAQTSQTLEFRECSPISRENANINRVKLCSWRKLPACDSSTCDFLLVLFKHRELEAYATLNSNSSEKQ